MKKLLSLFTGGLMFFSAMPAIALSGSELQEILKSDPGRIDATRTKEFKQKKIKKKKKKDTQNVEDLIKKDKKRDELDKTPEFTLNEIQFVGNTVIDDEDLQAVINQYIGKTITVNELLSITKEITAVYQDEGYLTSMAYLPPQKISGGVAKIEILEGKIGKINVKGNKWYKTRYVKGNILKSNKVEEDKVLNVNTIRSSLQEINNSEHLKGQVVIDESDDPEYIELTVEMEDRFPFDFGVTYDNQGRELVGKQRGLLTFSYDNVTGYGDQIYTGVALADGTFGVNTGYSIPVGDKGTRLNLDYSYSNVRVEGTDDVDIKAKNIRGFSNYFSANLVKPIIKDYDYRLYGFLGFDMRDARTYQKSDSTILSKYNTRVLRTGLQAIKDDYKGRWIANTTVSAGIPVLGARLKTFDTGQSGRSVGTNKFVKMDAGITRVQVLPKNSLGILKLAGQWATRRLLAAEQMQIGGIGTVRGFEEGFILGDWGVLSSAEIRTPVPFLKNILPEKLEFINDRVKWANFVDVGYVDEMHRSKGTYTNFLCGIGTGINVNLLRSLDFNLYLGIPVAAQKNHSNNVGLDTKDMRIHFNLTSDIY